MSENKILSFFKKNKKSVDTYEVKLESFEEPIEMRIISGKENEAIQKSCMKDVQMGRRKTKEMDGLLYNRKLVMNSIVFPDLTNTELQNAYGASGPDDLYGEMFNFAEQTILMEQVMERSGFNQTINDLVDDAKK